MKNESTKQEQKVREHSEILNPYSKDCPGRHLWSEGFRSGYNFGFSAWNRKQNEKPGIHQPEVNDTNPNPPQDGGGICKPCTHEEERE